MTYIIGFGILVALFASFPRTSIIALVIVVAGFYFWIQAERANNHVAETTTTTEQPCSEDAVRKLGYRNCAEQEEWVNRIMNRYAHD